MVMAGNIYTPQELSELLTDLRGKSAPPITPDTVRDMMANPHSYLKSEMVALLRVLGFNLRLVSPIVSSSQRNSAVHRTPHKQNDIALKKSQLAVMIDRGDMCRALLDGENGCTVTGVSIKYTDHDGSKREIWWDKDKAMLVHIIEQVYDSIISLIDKENNELNDMEDSLRRSGVMGMPEKIVSTKPK